MAGSTKKLNELKMSLKQTCSLKSCIKYSVNFYRGYGFKDVSIMRLLGTIKINSTNRAIKYRYKQLQNTREEEMRLVCFSS